ncbi:hypothetical protein OIO90_000352 [Microbotryomycetes sp. JL221]|nr:hypothetical protein OIO90_000352 [Microbotryomycetes sp. JL221]
MAGYGHRKQASSFGGGWTSVPKLSFADTLLVHAKFVGTGCLDAIKLHSVGQQIIQDRVVQGNIVKNALLQGVILVSALTIKPLIRHSTHDHSARAVTRSIFFWLFHLFWLWPLAAAATYYSGLLRPRTEVDRRVGRAPPRPDFHGQTAKIVAESYRALVTVNYFVVVMLLRYIPFVGPIISFLFACMVDSYYCFEQHWLRNRWSFAERVRFLESRWAYFIGWGLPITFVSWWFKDPLVNLSLFGLFFPFFQVLASSSMPQPLDPNLPTSQLTISFLSKQTGQTSFSMAAAEGGEEARGRKPSPYVPIRIPVLLPAERLYAMLMAAFVGRKKDASGASANTYDVSSQTAGWRSDYGGGSNGPQPSAHVNGRVYGHGGMGATPPRRGYAAPADTSGGVGDAGRYGAASGVGFGAPAHQASSVYGTPGSAYGQTSPAGAGVAVNSSMYASPPPNQPSFASGMDSPYSAPPQANMGGYADRNLDNLIRSAANRRKGD